MVCKQEDSEESKEDSEKQCLFHLTRKSLLEDVRSSKHALEEVIGIPNAPFFAFQAT